MCLWEFSWNFCDFRSIFRAFKQFLEFIWNCFRIKNNFEKNKQTLSNWAELEGPTQVRAGPAARQAHRLACPWRTHRRRRPFPPMAWVLGSPWGSALLFNACPSSCSRPRALRPVRHAACACSPSRRRQCQARRRRPRFAAFVDLRPEPAPPGAPGCRAASPRPLTVTSSTPEHCRPLRNEPAAMVGRRRPLAVDSPTR
jgi:hypothetical protein